MELLLRVIPRRHRRKKKEMGAYLSYPSLAYGLAYYGGPYYGYSPFYPIYPRYRWRPRHALLAGKIEPEALNAMSDEDRAVFAFQHMNRDDLMQYGNFVRKGEHVLPVIVGEAYTKRLGSIEASEAHARKAFWRG